MSKMTNLFSQDEAQTVRLKRLKKQPWRTFYSTFVPKAQRKLAQKQANDLQKKHIAQLWDLFLKDYFNGEATLEIATATAIINNGKITFLVPDPYGMDRFIDNVRIIKN